MDPMSLPALWNSILVHPGRTLEEQVKVPVRLQDGLLLYVFSSLCIALVDVLTLLANPLIGLGLGPSGLGALMSEPLTYGLFSFALALLCSLFWVGLLYALARLLGSRAAFATLYYLFGLIAVPIAVLHVLNLAPYIGGLLGLIVSLYGLYVGVRALQIGAGLSRWRALGAMVGALLVVVVLVALFSFASVAYLAASIAS